MRDTPSSCIVLGRGCTEKRRGETATRNHPGSMESDNMVYTVTKNSGRERGRERGGGEGGEVEGMGDRRGH